MSRLLMDKLNSIEERIEKQAQKNEKVENEETYHEMEMIDNSLPPINPSRVS